MFFSKDIQLPDSFLVKAKFYPENLLNTMIPTLSRTPRSTGLDLALLAVVATCLFSISVGARDLWNPNEAIYGRAVVEMAERGDWMVPTVNGKVFAEKPILYFWAALLSSRLMGGVDELTLRVPSVLAGIASVLLTYLLVLPYGGRRLALLAAALLATQYQVYWGARSVQMDILVLASTLGVLVPISRMLDFGFSPVRAWTLAGVAAGLGFAAKGPVALVLSGLVFLVYAAAGRKLHYLWNGAFPLGGLVAVVVASPWYLLLWLRGQHDFLYEVLIRQNFGRFIQAWDHHQPWWYYLKYFWIDYAPWSWLVPLAILLPGRDDKQRQLMRLSWIWIICVIGFFSLSDSKRAPYIVPIAPAVAALAVVVVERLVHGQLSRRRHHAGYLIHAFLGAVSIAGGAVVIFQGSARYPDLAATVLRLGGILVLSGTAVITGVVLHRRRPYLAPASLLAGMTALYFVASIWILPAINPRKSSRIFTADLNAQIATAGGELASYRFWDWRAGYPYYARRNILNLQGPEELMGFWATSGTPFLIVEGEHVDEVRRLIPEALVVLQREIGSRTAYTFTRPALGTLAGDQIVQVMPAPPDSQ